MEERKWCAAFATCGLLLFLSLASYGDEKTQGKLPPPPTNPGLEKMKKLVGTWLVADKDGKPTDQVASIIKVTAGGSAVHETLFPGQPQEMVSVYTAEGPDLIMTHYCVLGNQPRMKADPNSSANQIVFQFIGGGNLDPKKDKHMHQATLTIVDDDHITVNGTGWENGAPVKGHVLRVHVHSEEITDSRAFAVICSSNCSAPGNPVPSGSAVLRKPVAPRKVVGRMHPDGKAEHWPA